MKTALEVAAAAFTAAGWILWFACVALVVYQWVKRGWFNHSPAGLLLGAGAAFALAGGFRWCVGGSPAYCLQASWLALMLAGLYAVLAGKGTRKDSVNDDPSR